MRKSKKKADSYNQRYKRAIQTLLKRALRGEKIAKRMLEFETNRNTRAKSIAKRFHRKRLASSGIEITIASKEKLSPERQGLRLRVQSRGFGDGAHIPHSSIRKYGKDKKRK